MATNESDDRSVGEGRRETYRGHEIFFPGDKRHRRVFVDGRAVRYGTAGGQFFLDAYAYDRAESVEEVVRRYVDYLEARRGRGES